MVGSAKVLMNPITVRKRERARISFHSFINSKSADFYKTYKLEELGVGEQTKTKPA